jgi:hypothetical protein
MRSMVCASIAVAVLSFLILLLWAQTKIESFQRRAAINPRRILALTCFLVLMLGVNVALSAPLWGIACGDGRVDTILDDFDSPWVVCCTADPSIPKPTPRTVPGCHGNAMAVDYDLRNVAPPDSPDAGQSYIVLQRVFSSPRDLTNYTHIRLAWHGSNINSHDSIDVKLHDGHNLFATSLQSMTDLSANTADGQPVWRVIYIDLREFTGNGPIDLAHIDRLEIGIVRCTTMPGKVCEAFDNPSVGGPPEQHVGTLYLDEFAAVNLKPGAVNRLVETGFETVSPNPTVRAKAANALLAQIASSGPGLDLIPAWFPEPNPNFNSYAQAEELLVLVYEYERTGNVAFRDAAQKIATKLLSLQIPSGKTQAGAWYASYVIQGEALGPPRRASQPLPCDGNETLVQDIDTCEYVGNVGWLLIALGKLQRSGFYNNPTALQDALDRGAAWVAGQFNRNVGIEGSISAYFGLLAAGKGREAALLGQAIFQLAWDPMQRRLKPGGGPADAATPIDVTGSWGVTFLQSLGRSQEALDSQAYAASVMQVCSFDGSVCGYGDIAGPYTPAIEFTAQVASAGIKDTDFVMQQIFSLQLPNNGTYPGAFPGAADQWYGGPLTPWNTTMAGVSPTAWVYFALNGDPLLNLSTPPLTVTKVGTGSGTVTSIPVGINCPTTCSTSFPQGQSVTLSATAASGSAFQGWSSEGCSGAGTCTVTLTGDLTVTASFTSNTQGMSRGGGGGGCTMRPGTGFDLTLVGIMGLALTHLYWKHRRRWPSDLLGFVGLGKNPL